MRQGEIVFSPIAHTHPIATMCDLPKDWEFWGKFDKAFIEQCSQVVVAMIPGWKDSKGINAEIAIAKDLGKPIRYMRISHMRGVPE